MDLHRNVLSPAGKLPSAVEDFSVTNVTRISLDPILLFKI